MQRWVRVATSPGDSKPLPDEFSGNDVRYSEELVARFLDEYTKPNDVVLDPFAGFGTTLAVAVSMGRRAVGIELLPERAAFIRSLVGAARVVTGDARRLADLAIGTVDFVMTSPPYMTRNDHPENPLTGYRDHDGVYETYLDDLRQVFRQVRPLLRPGAHVVINVANLRYVGVTTTLAWDVARVVSDVLTLEREIVLLDDSMPSHLTQEYCLVFVR